MSGCARLDVCHESSLRLHGIPSAAGCGLWSTGMLIRYADPQLDASACAAIYGRMSPIRSCPSRSARRPPPGACLQQQLEPREDGRSNRSQRRGTQQAHWRARGNASPAQAREALAMVKHHMPPGWTLRTADLLLTHLSGADRSQREPHCVDPRRTDGAPRRWRIGNSTRMAREARQPSCMGTVPARVTAAARNTSSEVLSACQESRICFRRSIRSVDVSSGSGLA